MSDTIHTLSPAYQTLIHHMSQEILLTDQDILKIQSAFIKKELEKKEILLFRGDVSHHMRFVVSGCVRVYSIDDDGQEHIVHFGVKGWWINDLYSYLSLQPGNYFIQAVKPSVLLQIHRDQLNILFDEVRYLDRFFRNKFAHALVAMQERNMEGMSLEAKQRYDLFRKQYPEAEQLVPNYMIASFLGITPEFLSMLRKEK